MNDEEKFKQELIDHLKTKRYIRSVDSLWAYTKDFYKRNNILQGGSYATWNDWISVALNINNKIIRFNLSLDEIT